MKDNQKETWHQKLGFESNNQRQRYNRWRRKNNLKVDSKDSDYLKNIQYWQENIDIKF